MIKINIQMSTKNDISNLEVCGHEKVKPNEKISTLCAIVSTIILGGINFLNKKNIKKLIKIENKSGYTKIKVLKSNPEIQNALKMLIVQLQTINLYFEKKIIINFNKK